MTVPLILIFIFFPFVLTAQHLKKSELNKLEPKLNDTSIYIFARGTKQKAAIIAEEFNLEDRKITHVGIGFKDNRQVYIYHVTDNGSNISALQIDSIASFVISNDVYFFSVWEMPSRENEIAELKKICKSFRNKRIYFDAAFNMGDNDTLYCSEFCATVLNRLGNKLLSFATHQKQISSEFARAVLGRTMLSYFPVDFFQRGSGFKIKYEYTFY